MGATVRAFTRYSDLGDLDGYLVAWQSMCHGFRLPPGVVPTQLLFAPLGCIDGATVAAAFMVGGPMLAACGLWRFMRDADDPVMTFVVGLGLMLSDASLVSLGLGQWGHVMLGAWSFAPSRVIAIMAKPHLYAALIAVQLRRAPLVAQVVGGACIALATVALLVTQPWIASRTAVVWRWGVPGVLLVLVLVVIALRVPRLSVLTVIGLLVAPYARVYDYVILWGPVIRDGGRMRVVLAMWLVVAGQVAAVVSVVPDGTGARDERLTPLVAVVALVGLLPLRGLQRPGYALT